MNWRAAGAFVLLAMISLAVTLPWPEFSSGSENLVMSAAIETKREGNWLRPTLNGEPRTRKPPLVTWIAASSVPSSTIARFDQSDRDLAFDQMRWQSRWPLVIVLGALIASCWALARRLWPRDPSLALFTMIVVGTNYLVLRFERMVTTDIYLTLFIAFAHLAFVETILAKRKLAWLAGAFVGLAFMCKGPVALLFTIVPWILWTFLARTASSPSPGTPGEGRVRAHCGFDDAVEMQSSEGPHPGPLPLSTTGEGVRNRAPISMWLSILIAFAIVGLPWFAYILSTTDGVLDIWRREVTRAGATNNDPDHPLTYLGLPFHLAPWTVLFIVGLIDAITRFKKRDDITASFSLALLIIPIVILSIPSDRKERYALPLVIPCALLVARGLNLLVQNFEKPRLSDRIIGTLHWIMLGGMTIALGAIGTFFPKVARTIDDQPWFTKPLGISILALGILATIIGVIISMRKKHGLAWSSGVIMLLVWIGLSYGYRNSREAKSEMRPLAQQIVTKLPHAQLYQLRGTHAPSDLTLYANRIVANVDSIESIPDGPHDEIFIAKQRKREPIPTSPPGFELFTTTLRDSTTWWAFVRSH